LPDRRADTFSDLVHEAVTRCLEDAGVTIGEVDNIVTASNDFMDGRTISGMAVGDAAGAAFGQGKNVSTVEGDGAFAAFYGMCRILSGAFSTTLVVAHSKASEGDPRLIANACFDPIYERPLGLDRTSAAALQARAYLGRSGKTEKDCAQVVVRNRAHGASNPHAHVRQPVSVEEVLGSETLALPIRAADAAPFSDGAAAILLASERFAGKSRRRAAWVQGAAFYADARMTARPLWQAPALRAAARKAYAMAGVCHPRREIDVAEICEEFSYQQLLWTQELGLEGIEARRINPSGGCLCARAEIAAGLVRIVEAVLQLRGEAANQAPDVRRALAHGQNGLCGQSHCVWVLGR